MRILIVVKRMAYVRHFDRVVRLLSDRGHDVCLASQDGDLERRGVLSDQVRITSVDCPRNRSDAWGEHASLLRRARDYVRYLHPRYAAATKLRRRSFDKLVKAISGPSRDVDPAWSEMLLGINKVEQKRLAEFFRVFEQSIPSDPALDDFVAAQRPDVVICCPMVDVGFSQADFVKSARKLGVPSAMLVFSWDNLSNKGLVHEIPDRVLVWNKLQRREAMKLHGIPEDRLVVTGAPRFDDFFDMRPETDRREFCAMTGLEPSRPIISYLCSSKFISPREREFADRWLAEIRGDARLSACSIVFRPHPGSMDGWHGHAPAVVRWQRSDDKGSVSKPFDDPAVVVMSSPFQNADQVLYDTVFHSAAVVGLNTSAEIEAGIVGRPVFTVVDPLNPEGQEGTLHFHYLLSPQGGHVTEAATFEEHRAHLAAAIAGEFDPEAIQRFTRKFVRPAGLDVPVAPILADAIETLAALRPTPPTPVFQAIR